MDGRWYLSFEDGWNDLKIVEMVFRLLVGFRDLWHGLKIVCLVSRLLVLFTKSCMFYRWFVWLCDG